MHYKSIFNTAAAVAVAATFSIGCNEKPDDDEEGPVNPTPAKTEFVDSRDDKVYKKVTIGKQVWMAENLDYEVEGSVCYNNSPDNCVTYGRLYTWEAALTACPAGWHLSTDAEWTALTYYVGMNAGTKLKSTSGWYDGDSYYKPSTDAYGFSALPGSSGGSNGYFDVAGYYGGWWSATESNAFYAWYRGMDYHDEGVSRDDFEKNYSLLSVRCVQD